MKLGKLGTTFIEQNGDKSLIATPNPYNRDYLVTKQKKLGHRLEIPDASDN